jgi:hypothetical protein
VKSENVKKSKEVNALLQQVRNFSAKGLALCRKKRTFAKR